MKITKYCLYSYNYIMKARYLTFFSYIGTPFRSSEKLWFKGGKNYPDPESVQGLIELALLKLRSINYPSVTLSSRTDQGVHALNSTAHFDLERFGSNIYDPEAVAYLLNKTFFKSCSSINVKSCIRVNDHFNARYNAIRRTYLYRLAVMKSDVITPEEYTSIGSYLPIEEWKRCHFIRNRGFNIDLFKESAKYFIGYHDFTTFKKFDKLKQHKHNRREIYGIEVRPGKPLVTSYTENSKQLFDYWDIEIRGRAYVHNQIRRMIGTLITVAIGKLRPEDVKVMLQVPSKHSWFEFIANSPPHGLYLANVEYNPEDLIYDPDKGKKETKEEEECDSDIEE